MLFKCLVLFENFKDIYRILYWWRISFVNGPFNTASEEDKQLPSPFTRAPTASLVLEKEKQTKEKTSQQGSSKILSKAREKAEHDSKKVSGKILL